MTRKKSQILKGIAILFMFFHHLYRTSDKFEEYGLTDTVVGVNNIVVIARGLKICVAIFAFISGYGLYRATEYSTDIQRKLGIKAWVLLIIKRYWHLIRDVIFLMSIMLPMSMIFNLPRTPFTVWKNGGKVKIIKGIITNMTGTAGFFGYKWFVSSWWYLSISVLFIFLFPVLFGLMRHVWNVLPLAIVITIPFVFHVKANHDNVWRYLPAFVLGMFIANVNLIEKLIKIINSSIVSIVIFEIIIVAILSLLFYLNHLYDKQFLFQSLEAAIFVIGISVEPYNIPVISKALEYLGNNSKIMWLTHVFIYGQILGAKLFALKNIWAIWLILITLSLAVSVVLKKCTDTIYAYIERIFGKIKSA